MKQGGREGLKPIKPESYREAVSYILQVSIFTNKEI
jgi:hypothetical protein